VEPLYEGAGAHRTTKKAICHGGNLQLDWADQAAFLDASDSTEAQAARIAYRDFSHCRICGEAFRLAKWEWPAGFRHDVVDHDARPSREFEPFVVDRGRRS
jgi:hypothetical protein